MSAHRRHVITRKSDGFFWCGMFGFQKDPSDAQVYDSLKSAYRAVAELGAPDPVTVEPADWYLPRSVLNPLECSP